MIISGTSLCLDVLLNHFETVADGGLYCRVSMGFMQGRQYTVQVKVLLKHSDVAKGKCCRPANERVFMPQEDEAILLCPSPVFFIPRGAVKGGPYLLGVFTTKRFDKVGL